MLKESLKWFLLTLLAAAMIGAAIFGAIRILKNQGPLRAEQTPAPSATAERAEERTPIPEAEASPTEALPEPTPEPTPVDTDALLKAYVAGLTVEQKLGQLVLFGFSGTDTPDADFFDIMERYGVGNYILYGINIRSDDSDGGFARCSGLTTALRAGTTGGIPPLVAIDVEGGSVVRFRWDSWPASAAKLGEKGDRAAAVEQFAAIGAKLRSIGVHMNLAPVLDVAPDPSETFLKTRIISSSAEVAAQIGTGIVEGLHQAGCLSTAKHFPGHGGTDRDSHDETPVVDKSAEALAEYDLVPFAAAVDAGVDAILVAHILYPALDETDVASMSSAVIDGLLRGQMGFSGVVISDDFRMSGLKSRYEAGDAAVRFLLAGGDLIMCGAQHERQALIMEGLYAAAADGRLTQARIDESVLRILRAKMAVTGWSPIG